MYKAGRLYERLLLGPINKLSYKNVGSATTDLVLLPVEPSGEDQNKKRRSIYHFTAAGKIGTEALAAD